MAKRSTPKYSIGVDYGTNSVRALVVDTANGRELGTSVFDYPSGTDGILLDPKDHNLARQNPADYVLGFEKAVASAVAQASKKRGFSPDRVVGIGVDTTGSTPIPVDRDGTPLAMKKAFRRNLNAMAWLWKDHTAFEEAAAITETARKMKRPFLAKCGGVYSSEWFWSKIWHCLKVDRKVFEAAYSWVELADFVPAWICGTPGPETLVRGVCAAGHKAMYHPDWGGLPDKRFLKKLAPELADLRDRLYEEAVPSDHEAGRLCAATAKKVGLPAGIPVAAGAFDAHHGAVGSGVRPGRLVKILGTSTCDIMVAPGEEDLPDIPGLCGIVPGSVVPGMYGLEAGQSAVGDIFNWFVSKLCPPEYQTGDPHMALSKAADKLAPGESGLLALDWNNGNRTILVDPLLTGMLVGTTLHTTAPEVYRALVEATAFGSRAIIERFEEYGVRVREVVTGGGIAEKNAFVMQIYADVWNRPIKLSRSGQTCALGAAIFGAVAGGASRTTAAAQRKMTATKERVYRPRKKAAQVYDELYALYRRLHDAFGTDEQVQGMETVMKDLLRIRREATK
jgi:L-ribulokinase